MADESSPDVAERDAQKYEYINARLPSQAKHEGEPDDSGRVAGK